jgi:putative transposase
LELVSRAQAWKWSSLGGQRPTLDKLLSPWPLERPADWTELVNEPLDPVQRQRIKSSMERGRPLGEPQWAQNIARRLGLLFTLNPRGRPPKEPGKTKTEEKK